jgi:hypothetical protein
MAGLLETLRRAWGAAWDTPNTTDYLRRDLTWAAPGGGGGGAPTSSQYVTLATDATLTAERVLTAGTALSLTDAGAGSTITVAVSDAELLALAGTTSAADALPYFTGAGTATTTTLTSQARALLDDTTQAAQRATVGASAVTVNGGSLADVDLDDASPAAGAGDLNVKWQQSGGNVSAYVDVSALSPLLSLGYQWVPGVPPSSAHAQNDEFATPGALPGAWSTFAPGTGVATTIDVDDYGLRIQLVNTAGANRFAAVYQAVPTDDEYEIIADLRHTTASTSASSSTHLIVFEDAAGAPTTTDLLIMGFEADGDVICARFSSYTTFTATVTNRATQAQGGYACFQIKTSTKAVHAWWSVDGIGWRYWGTVTLAYAPAEFGVTVSGSTSTTVEAHCDFIRLRSAASGIINTIPSALGGRA